MTNLYTKVPMRIVFAVFFIINVSFSIVHAQNFSQNNVNFNGNGSVANVTSLMYGPDGRLYVAEVTGTIKVLTIERNGPGNYVVTASETLTNINEIQNHNDDGTTDSSTLRETTGLTVVGTAENPIIYVSSSDFRIGAGSGGGSGDLGLDTNSGIITRLTLNNGVWEAVDMVRGLPRSEENHATNGLEFATINGIDYLIVAQGGHTNAGAPSINFVFTCEYALSGAVLSVNLTQLESMPILNDNGRAYIYDIPTLDDPTRANANGINDPDTPGYDGIDVNDPFGGNDGLNQAMLVPNGPVQIFSPGYRNTYDLVLTESGAVYVTDNGANRGWGGLPANEGLLDPGTGTSIVTNNYDPAEPGSNVATGGELIDNVDHLQLVTTDIQNYNFGALYGGHPNPVRANPLGAGLYTAPLQDGNTGAVFRTQIYDPDGSTPGSTTDPNLGLPANWPPVPLNMANADEGDWRGPSVPNPDGPGDNNVINWGTNTNGIDEYTASNFGGAMQGDLLAGTNGGLLRRLQLNASGGRGGFSANFISGLGGNALGISCNSDTDIFPGTIWVGTLNGRLIVLEPQDFIECLQPGDPGYDPLADNDNDGYSNQDEIDNGTDICNGGSQPNDFDQLAGGALISDLNDTDDDNDGILDANDPFQLGDPLLGGSDAFTVPISNELFSDTALGGFLGLGMTGLMNNGDTNQNWLNWIDRRDDPNDPNPNDILGGAIGAMTMQMTSGTALGGTNTQEKGFQYGVQVDQSVGVFTVAGNIVNFDAPLQLYGNVSAPNAELGFFIGDGTQSNYIKFVLTQNGFTALQEINDVPQAPVDFPIPTLDRPQGSVVLYFVVDPSTGSVNLQFAADGGERTTIGTVMAQGSILNAIQGNAQDLAVGFIGTSNAPGVEVEGTWGFLNVTNGQPTIVQDIANIERTVGTDNETLDLNTFFADGENTANLTYSIEGNTDTRIGASIVGNTLTLSYPDVAAIAEITIRATDAEGNSIAQTFTVLVSGLAEVLYRVNAGGLEIPAIDGGIAWGEDTTLNNSPFLAAAGTDNVFGFTLTGVTPEVNQSTTPLDIFDSERFDLSAAAPDMTYSFPITESGNYEVRVYLGNGYEGTNQIGDRFFDILIEGNLVQDNFDPIAAFGDLTGGVLSFQVEVTDGVLDIVFDHQTENPFLNALEILSIPTPPSLINIAPIADQNSAAGSTLDGTLFVVADGGEGALQYAAQGLPPGIVLNPTTGQLTGTVEASAAVNSPYNVVITVDDSDATTSDSVTETFTWSIFNPINVLYRVNAGGPEIPAIDGGIAWGEDTTLNNSPFLAAAGTDNVFGFTLTNFRPEIDQNTTPLGIFDSERFDLSAAAPDMTYSFPIIDNGAYEVRIYLGNGFDGTNQVGDRFFDILIEGNLVEDDFDPIAAFGDLTGGVLTYQVTVTDGALDIVFDHQLENPFLNAIEIIDNTIPNTPIAIDDIADQLNVAGAALDGNLTVTATGGQGALQYSAEGLPPGVLLNANTGQFTGSIDALAAANSPYTVTVTADDTDGDTTDIASTTFIWTINVPSNVLYRVNAGGPEIPSIDGDIAWGEDTTVNNSPFLSQAGTDNVFGFTLTTFTPEVDQTTTPLSIFDTERFDLDAAVPDMTYSFPVVENGDYVVRIYLGNGFDGTNQVGDRFFDILIEGNLVEDDFDPIAAFGDLTGGVLTYQVPVTDGILDIVFDHQLENPFLNAIEILRATAEEIPIEVTAIPDQNNDVNTALDGSLGVIASGGNGNLQYTAEGLPPGVVIEPTNGQIGGTIAADAYINSPYNVSITVDDSDLITSDNAVVEFQWIINPLWTDLNENENYTPRHENSFVQAGDRFYLMGGRENANTVDVYDYTNDSWQALNNITPLDPNDPTRRLEFNHFQATEYQGLIWVIGAFQTNNFPNEVPAEYIWIFDPVNLEWIQGPEIPVNRRRGSAGLALFNDRFYILGGNTDGHDGGFVPWFDEYDPATGVWTVLEDAPNPRDHFSAVVIGDSLYAAAGRLSGGNGGVFAPVLSEVDRYDFTTNQWTTLPADQNIPTPRAGAATVGYNDQLIVLGGESLAQNGAFDVTEVFDTASGEWRSIDNLNHARQGTQAILSGDGIFTLGGSPNRGGGNQRNLEVLGVNAPVGETNIAAPLTAPATVTITNGDTADITLAALEHTYGIYIRSMEISGPSAANFSMVSGEVNTGVIAGDRTNGFSHTLTVGLDSTFDGNAAVLTINYGEDSSISINLTDDLIVDPEVVNPGNQENTEGDVVALPIQVTNANGGLTYSATNLPPGLNIDAATGLISGTISGATTGGAFNEANGVLVIEMESGELEAGWSQTNTGGALGITASEDHFNDQNGGMIPYEITINTPGVYRFNWRNLFGGNSSTDQNDSWLRLPNTNGVWFFGFQGNPISEAALISNLQGAQNNIVFPVGSGRETAATRPEGATANGYLKIYRSGGSSGVYDWQARTSDNDAHEIYVWFENAGTYTMEVSERSAGHVIDKMALYRVDGPDFSDAQLTALSESSQTQIDGAAANSPYNVEVQVSGTGTSTIDFIWTINEPEIGIVWIEDFEDLGNGTTVDNGTTAWSSTRNGGVFQVENGAFLTNGNSNGPGVWTSEIIPITGAVSLTIDVNDGDDTKETADFVRASYRVDGGPLVQFGEVRGDINPQTFTADNITGSTIQIIVEADVSFSGEFYTIDNVTVFGQIDSTPPVFFDLLVENGTGDGSFEAGQEVIITADAPLPGQEFLAWTGDVGGIQNVNSASTSLTMPAANITINATYRDIPTAGIIWLEDFEDLANGATIDNGSTAWTSTRDAGQFEVQNGVFVTSVNSNAPGVWTSELIAINGTVSLSVDVNDGDNNKETADFVRASYSVDGGPLIQFGEVRDDIEPQTFTVNNIVGSTVQIVIEADVSFDNEVYTFDNVTVIGQDGGNQIPVAVADATPITGTSPLEVNFTGGNSTDDGTIVTYDWNFDDGNTSTAINPTHTYTSPGVYNASLRVVDDEGAENTATVQITVTEPVAPEGVVSFTLINADTNTDLFELTEGMQIEAGTVQNLLSIRANTNPATVGSVSFSLSGPINHTQTENIFPYALFGDSNSGLNYGGNLFPVGNYTITATSFSQAALGGTPGQTLTIQFSIVDTVGNTNIPPSAVINASTLSGEAPLEIDFVGSNSSDDVGIVSYEWNFDDGNTSTGINPTHSFNSPGVYTVSLRVVDTEGLEDTTSTLVTVDAPSVQDGVVSFTLVNATTNQDLIQLTDGMDINAFTIQGIDLAIRANTNIPVGSVQLAMSGPINTTRTENVAPYALFGDNGGNYAGVPFPSGSYSLSATSFSGANGGGAQGPTIALNFTIVPQAAARIDNTSFANTDTTMRLFPNPVIAEAQIEVPDTTVQMRSIQIFDLTGRLVKQYDAAKVNVGSGRYGFNVSAMDNGLYFIHMTSEKNEKYQLRMIISR
ncbi:malectin domain-containing carbohydrate-binding protein [Spongiimicrobium salis]|uniref:malectin domain-containing carbohydrate-binding protein n=1 Tax=Spongiimicrobium salis TaxID=1667022 RepID=UPI00374D4C7C